MRTEHPQEVVHKISRRRRHGHAPRGFWAHDEETDCVCSIYDEVQNGCCTRRKKFYCWRQTPPLHGSVVPAKLSALRNSCHHFPAQHDMRRLRPQEFQRQCCVVRRHEHVRRVSGHRTTERTASTPSAGRKLFQCVRHKVAMSLRK